MIRFLTLASLVLTAFLAQAQVDAEKLMGDFEAALKDPKAVPYGHNKETGRYFAGRGFKMYYEVYGSGEPLLIIHGNGGSINNFIYQIPYFAQHYKVIIADNRAQGRSHDYNNDSLTYEMMADDYAALLDSLKIDSAYVIGWSDGGINGLLLALRHPEKVKKMALAGANLQPDTTAVPQEVWDLVRPSYEELAAKPKLNAIEKSSFKLLRLLCTQPHIDPASLSQIKAPALIIGGDHDVIREEHTLLIYKSLPRAYLWIVPGSGHSVPILYKDEFNKTVERFFKTPYKTFSGQGRFM
ncbi:MAG: alpha/beta hydrolase [Chitinophagaceae bacterium]|nr:alpha/beta hydrolase [Chitinophagaceae bacterium]